MKLFYCNITYTCNQSCIYCYSHNTVHTSKVKNEINLTNLIEYLNRMGITTSDRVILNGGEPFLHTHIVDILKSLKPIGCEVLIYTNGTLIKNYDLDFLTSKFRFVIPTHGFPELHDKITCHKGGFVAMSESIDSLRKHDCLVDVKLILNDSMIANDDSFDKTLKAFETLQFNHAIHIRKMVDTITSKRNNCSSVTMDRASIYTAIAFNRLKEKGIPIKMFDTCIKLIDITDYYTKCPIISVYFKDCSHERKFVLGQSDLECRKTCNKSDKCHSAVGNYTVLEYYNGEFYENVE